LTYVSKHKTETKGTRLWKIMEEERVTTHSWQSMKYHYQVPLAKRYPEVVEVATTEENTDAAESETKVMNLKGIMSYMLSVERHRL